MNATTPSAYRAAITLSTLEKRIRRHLAADGLQLRKNRAGTIEHQLHGDWSVIEPKNHVLILHSISLAELGRVLGVLADHEDVEGNSERWYQITLPVISDTGVRISQIFQVQARHFTKPVRDALRDAYPTAGQCIESDTLLLMAVLSGWRHVMNSEGEELPFTHASVFMMLDTYPNAAKAIVEALLKEIGKEAGIYDL